jgi:uncharacterized membrane protein YheB (UPF0754 family)
MIRVVNMIDGVFEKTIEFIKRINKNKNEVKQLIKCYGYCKAFCDKNINHFTDEICDDVLDLIKFVYSCIAVLLNFKLNNWATFKLRLINEITDEMEEQKITVTEYDYLRRYNELKQSIDLLETFNNVFDRIIEVEITTDCNMIFTLIPDNIMECFRNEFSQMGSNISITA